MSILLKLFFDERDKTMHLTLETDYAIRIMDFLYSEKSKVDARTISLKTGVTLRFSLKILRKLVAGKIIRSYQGMLGGYEAVKPMDEVTLNDIVELIEGPFTLSKCLDNKFSCSLNDEKGRCKYHRVFEKISLKVTDELRSLTFADLNSQ